MADRTLILHPGFAKCATSSIQRAFVIEQHELARSMGVRVLGRGLIPDNGYPEVSKLMYSQQACIDELQAQEYPPGRYFLSNEAAQGAPAFIEALKRIFQIETTVFTIRLPELQAVSNFCYSGWLTHGMAELLSSATVGVFSSADRMRNKLAAFQNLVGQVKLCPVEDDDGSLYGRFCRTAFGERPTVLNAPRYVPKKSNPSISLGFAMAMHDAMKRLGIGNVPGPSRQAIVKAAQKYSEKNALPKRLPACFHHDAWRDLPGRAQAYGQLLAAHGVAKGRVRAAESVAEARIAEFLGQPVCNAAEERELIDHAVTCLKSLDVFSGLAAGTGV